MVMVIQEKTLTLNNLTVHYLEAGADNGRVLLLIHGGLSDARGAWAATMPLLADEFRVIAPDLPGFGKSTPLPDASVIGVNLWLKTLLDSLNIDQAAVVANSFGGLFARLFATSEPGYVPALMLVNGGSIPDIPSVFGMIARLPLVGSLLFQIIGRQTASAKSLKRMVHMQEVLTPQFIRSAAGNASNFSRLMRGVASHAIPEKRTPSVPTLILWGMEDQLAPLEEGKRIKNSIPGAKLVEIEACGHMPQLEAPEVFVWQVKQFLLQLSRPRKSSQGAGQLSELP